MDTEDPELYAGKSCGRCLDHPSACVKCEVNNIDKHTTTATAIEPAAANPTTASTRAAANKLTS